MGGRFVKQTIEYLEKKLFILILSLSFHILSLTFFPKNPFVFISVRGNRNEIFLKEKPNFISTVNVFGT